MNITAKIIRAEIKNGRAEVKVKLDDGEGFVWMKSFSYNTTSVIKLEDFKSRLKAEIEKDRNIETQLDELKPMLNESFSLTIADKEVNK